MIYDVLGSDGFSYLKLTLDPNDSVIVEAGAMISMDIGLEVSTSLNGGLISAALKSLLGRESLFVNHYTNHSNKSLDICLSHKLTGSIRELTLNGNSFCIEGGSYIASTPGVNLGVRYGGIASYLGREGLFKLLVSGQGTVWIGGYGGLVDHYVDNEFVVDTGHLLAYESQIRLRSRLAGGLIGSWIGNEGLVTRLVGTGRIILQTRSLPSLAAWANPKFI